MRKIYTLLLALVATMTAFAQNPDPSKWEKGQNVIEDLGMQDVDPTKPWTTKSNGGSSSGTANYGDYWKGVGQKFFFDYIDQNDAMYGDHETANTCMGYYGDGRVTDDNPDVYQVIKMPAGYYTIRVQACYRDASGQQTTDCFNAWKAGKSKKNAWAYVEAFADEASAVDGANPTRTFITPIRHIFDTECTENLCSWTPNGDDWRNDGSYKITESVWDPDWEDYVEQEVTYYYPRSIIGASYFFQKGFYWNEFKILLDKDTYVRVGYRKTDYVTEDWLALSEWQIIYNDGYTTDAQVDFAETEFETETATLEEWKTKYENAKFDGFDASFTAAIVDKISDDLMNAEATFEGLEGDELLDFIKDLKQSNLDYETLYQYLGHLSFVLVKSKTLLESTDYPGKAAFQSAYDEILGKINGCTPADFEETTPYDFCMKYFNELADARGDYLDTQEADENGAKDFSAVINHPWFVNDGVKISQDEDGNYFIDEETWLSAVGGGDANYADKLTYTQDDVEMQRTPIASDVNIVLNDENVKNEWFQRIRYEGKTNGLYLYYDDRGLLGAADTWHAGAFTSGSMDVCQNIVGLPSGYYSLKGLVRGWGSSGNGNFHNIFMENNQGDVMKSPLASAEDEGWQEMTTGIIHVSDRQLLIGGQSDYNAHYTGFRLLFYGEEPPVDKLIRQEIAEVKALAEETLTFEGDKKYVADLIAKCVEPYEGVALFEEYRGYLNEARTYIKDAKKEYGNYKAIDTYTDILSNNSGVAGVSDIVGPAQLAATELGEGANDTYKDIAGANELATKYGDYIKVYAEAVSLDDASLNATLSDQKAALVAAVATTATLDQYIASLATPININKMADLGAASATEAAPADVTALIVNPTFELEVTDGVVTPNDPWERGHSYGWTFSGSGNSQSNEYSRGNYEVWNAGSSDFTFSQKLSGMPAGIYELSVLAVYRDGSAINASMVEAYDAAGSKEAWENHNAVLFAKTESADEFTYLNALETLKGTEPSFTGVVTSYEINEDTNEPYATAMTICAPEGEGEDATLYGFENYPEMQWTHGNLSSQPFDSEVEVGGTTYYFPESMYGFYMWEVKAPEKLLNTVRVEVKNGETLEIGLRKTGGSSGDWVIFDDFKLKYISGATFKDVATGIETVDSEQPAQKVLYNTAGQIVDDSYKGIVIDSEGNKFIKQ
jgi:hypothetical protein